MAYIIDSYVYTMLYFYYWPMLTFDKQAKLQNTICKPQGVKNG